MSKKWGYPQFYHTKWTFGSKFWPSNGHMSWYLAIPLGLVFISCSWSQKWGYWKFGFRRSIPSVASFILKMNSWMDSAYWISLDVALGVEMHQNYPSRTSKVNLWGYFLKLGHWHSQNTLNMTTNIKCLMFSRLLWVKYVMRHQCHTKELPMQLPSVL